MPCAAAAAASARLISPAAGVPPVMPVTISGARIVAAEQRRRQVDVGGGALGQRAVDQVHVVEQRRAVKRGRAGRGDRQVIGLALADAAVRH